MGVRGKDLKPRFRRSPEELNSLRAVFKVPENELVPGLDELLMRRMDIDRAKATRENLQVIKDLLSRQFPPSGDKQELWARFDMLRQLANERQEGDTAAFNRIKLLREDVERRALALGGTVPPPRTTLDMVIPAGSVHQQAAALMELARAAGINPNDKNFKDQIIALYEKAKADKANQEAANAMQWKPIEATADLQYHWDNGKPQEHKPAPVEEKGVVTYPFLDHRKSAQLLRDNGFTAEYNSQSRKLWVRAPGGLSACLAVFKETFHKQKELVAEGSNLTGLKKHLKNDDPNERPFYGPPIEKVLAAIDGDFDFSLFLQKRAQLSSAAKELEETYSGIENRRIRKFSDKDGELDYDRRWEREPFSRGDREPKPIHAVTLKIDITFNSGVSPEAIAEYGAYAWAVADFIESKGYRCEIIICVTTSEGITGRRVDDKAHVTPKLEYLEITLKKAGEYVDLMQLAKCFTEWFYRRVTFQLETLIADACGLAVCSSLGAPKSDFKGLVAQPGLITMQSSSAGRNIKLDDLKRAIVTSLGIQVTEVV